MKTSRTCLVRIQGFKSLSATRSFFFLSNYFTLLTFGSPFNTYLDPFDKVPGMDGKHGYLEWGTGGSEAFFTSTGFEFLSIF